MDNLFVHMLQETYDAEQQIVKNLPMMIDKASNPERRAGFQHHLGEIQGHVKDSTVREPKHVVSACGDQ
jgi:ferritin-like metal-binding protein YciE